MMNDGTTIQYQSLRDFLDKVESQRPSKLHSSKKGADTYQRILVAARTVFEESGYAGLSYGRIAGNTGLGKGNVVYHFKNKTDILEAIVANELADYFEIFGEALDSHSSPEKNLTDLYGSIMSKNEENKRFLMQIWHVSIIHKEVRLMLQRAYSIIYEYMMILWTQALPSITKKQGYLNAKLTVTAIEGITMQSAIGQLSDRDVSMLRQRTLDSLRLMLSHSVES